MALPLPKVVADVQAGGPLVTSMEGINALRQSQATAKYAPYQAYGNAYLTNQEAQWVPYKYQMQALSNPMLWMAAQNNPKLQQQINDMMKNPLQTVGNAPSIPQPGQGGLMNAFLSKIGLGSDQQSGSKGSGNPMLNMPMGGQQQTGSDASQPSQATDQPAMPGQPPATQPLPGSGMNNNPYFQAKQAEASSGAQGNTNVDLWKSLNESTGTASVQAQDTLNDLDRLESAYGDLGKWEKGYFFGKGPAVTSEAQIADQASSSLRASVLRQLQQGHITDKDVNTFGTIKPDRSLNPEAMDQAKDFLKGASLRSQERAAFNNQAANMGLTAPQANLLWTKYINDRPFYSAKDKSLNEKNLGTYGDYLKPDKMNSILSGNENKQSPSGGSGSFDVKKMLDYKYSNADEFKQAFNSLNAKNKKIVLEEMNNRGWK